MFILTGNYGEKIGKELQSMLDIRLVQPTIKKFPDGELYVRVNEKVMDDIAIIVNNAFNGESILETSFLINAIDKMGVKKIITVIPYLGYTRQDKKFLEGEAISSEVIAKFLSMNNSEIFIVEPHSNNIEKYFSCKVNFISPAEEIAKNYANKIDMVISPDKGGIERAKVIASLLGVDYSYLNKKRISSYEVAMDLNNVSVKGKRVLLVDDVISTGGTILKALELLKNDGASEVHVVCTHGLFLNNSDINISQNSTSLSCTNTLNTKYSRISISPLIAKQLEKFIEN
ncbi:MAG: ribose-phosphate diphosphokinase [Thermoplasmata archaeon]